MVSGPSFFIDGPSKDEIDDAIALARAWAIQVTDPASLVSDEDYSSKQWALWSQQYAATVASGNHILDSHTDVVLTSPSANQVLTYNGTNWINQSLTAVSTIDSANVTFTPSTLANWTGSADPGDADDAFNQLASRVKVIESATVSVDAADVTYTPNTLTDWNSSADPGNTNGALNQLASRLKVAENKQIESIIVACSDEATALTTGTSKVTFRMPYAMTVSGVKASLSTAQTAGAIFTVDINEGGTSILSTKLTIDNTEKTSATAAIAAVLSDTALAADAEITVDIDQVGDGTAKGLKITINGSR